MVTPLRISSKGTEGFFFGAEVLDFFVGNSSLADGDEGRFLEALWIKSQNR